MAVDATSGFGARARAVIERADKHTSIRHDAEGSRIDAWASAETNWDVAKLQYMLATGTGIFALLAGLDYAMPNLIAPDWPAAALAVVFGGASVGSTLLGLKNTLDAGVWAVVAGAQRLLGQKPGAPLGGQDAS